jgi:hypothetical protein
MTKTLRAVFVDHVFRPQEPIDLPDNTPVQITVETNAEPQGKPYSFIDACLASDYEGPPDLSENVDEYLYRGKQYPGE